MEGNTIQINVGLTINGNVKCKKHDVCEKDYIWNAATYSCANEKYLSSIRDDLAIMCNEFIESYD